ncbi:MAG TPA: murein L,D-transpeptidase [Firmicutes bacterium]|nr:murein L,D-transpeptidase [Bacillota bacterium]
MSGNQYLQLLGLALAAVAALLVGARPAAAETAVSRASILAPEVLAQAPELSGASGYTTRAQQLVADLVAAGETDIDELVAVIVTDNREVLDHIVINLAEQRVYECNVAGEVLRVEKTSTGARGYETPVGDYKVVNRAPKAYSEKYEAWMLHWMGLTADGAYGMHGLEGSSYERLLGRVASHGCVRLSREYAKDLYSRVRVGLPVKVVNEENLDLAEYEPLSQRAARSLVLEVLSPADPWEVFY